MKWMGGTAAAHPSLEFGNETVELRSAQSSAPLAADLEYFSCCAALRGANDMVTRLPWKDVQSTTGAPRLRAQASAVGRREDGRVHPHASGHASPTRTASFWAQRRPQLAGCARIDAVFYVLIG